MVTGLSRGGMNLNAFLMDSEFSAKIDCAVNIVGAGGLRSSTVPFGTNFCAVWAAADGIDANSFFGYDENGVDKRLLMVRELLGDDSYEYGTLLGSFEMVLLCSSTLCSLSIPSATFSRACIPRCIIS